MKRNEYVVLFDQGKSLEQRKSWKEATRMYDQVIEAAPEFLQVRRRRAECLMRLQRWPEAEQDVRHLFDANAPIINRDIKRIATICSQQGKYDEAASRISSFADQWLGENTAGLSSGQVILTAAVPKTGSTSLSFALAAATGWPRANFLCYQNSPMGAGVPSMAALQKLKGIGIINHCHLVPDEDILEALGEMPWVKTVVQFRNPVETLLSTVDMMVRDQTPIIFAYASVAPDAPFEDIAEWVIADYLPHLIIWMERWAAAIDQGHPSILGWTTLDEIKDKGQDTVARQMLETAGIGPIRTMVTEPQRTGQRLQGSEKVVFSSSQEERIVASIPDHLRKRFNW
ncbi:MAG: tetratricopeptide repeat protein [Hyphomicrobiales bacterium]|nr:tetratricopeptide repeat protein [Hyphomicrobiales bacterium]